MREHSVKGSNVVLTADLAAWHDLNEVDPFFPSRNDFSRSESSRKHNNLALYGKFDQLEMESIAREKLCPSIQTLLCRRRVHYSTSPHDHVGHFFPQVRNDL